MKQFPQTLYELIEYLDSKYPERTPRMPLSEWELGFLAGQRDVVDSLKVESNYMKIEEKEK